jgi:hypothetical protein
MAADCCGVGRATIEKLPDEVLLEIFDVYLNNGTLHGRPIVDKWHTLVHVCRRWRNVVFASPCRLDLRLLCRNDRPVRAMLDIWPALPIDIEGVWERWETVDNIVAALERPDRVRSINLDYVPDPQGERLLTAMQVRSPELTELRFWSWGRWERVLPDSFLGGSAPRLRTLWLMGVPFPAAPNLLLSASDLVDLRLDDIPHSGYIPPASMVACLSSLNKLELLSLRFASPQSRPDRPSPPPQSRVVLPALIRFVFKGRSEYSEDLVTRIDTPALNRLDMTFFLNPIIDVRHLKQFTDRAKGLKPSEVAELQISSWTVRLDLQQPHGLSLGVSCVGSDRLLSSLALLCSQVSHLFSLVERLDLVPMIPPMESVGASAQFLEISRPFTATRSLYVHKDLVPLVATALQELIGDRATEVLPNLRDLFLGGPATSGSIQQVMQPFVDARRLSGQPVAVHYFGGNAESGPFFIPL